MWLVLIISAFTIIYLIYYYLLTTFDYWKKRGVPNPPVSYIFGNIKQSLTLEKSLSQIITDIYRDYSNSKYVGFYKFRKPGIIVRDIELVKRVLIKEFSSFHDNDIFIDSKDDPIGGRNTFVLKGEAWKIAKSRITPCFTPKRLKSMYPFMESSANKMLKYIDEINVSCKEGFEANELSAKYATEVVACCAFGLEGKTFEDPNPKFREMGRKIFEPSPFTIFKSIMITVFPSLARVFKIKFVENDVSDYFRNIILAALRYRKENDVIRNDFLDSMKELSVKYDDFTVDNIVAEAMGFFIDGYATSSSLMSYALFHIAHETKIQEKLLKEINNALVNNNGELDYDILYNMKYLEGIIYEALRMHPPSYVLNRMVTQPTVFPSPCEGGAEVSLEVGTPIVIPIHGIQNDPQYFTNPECFDPERFENNLKELQSKCIFLPFGEGPRSCHGQKFGLLQIKLAIARLVAKYEIVVNDKTIIPLEIDPKRFITYAKGGIWLNFLKRQN